MTTEDELGLARLGDAIALECGCCARKCSRTAYALAAMSEAQMRFAIGLGEVVGHIDARIARLEQAFTRRAR